MAYDQIEKISQQEREDLKNDAIAAKAELTYMILEPDYLIGILNRIEELETKGSPGVMHEIDQDFYNLAIKERDYERVKVDRLETQVSEFESKLSRLEAVAVQQAENAKNIEETTRVLEESVRNPETIVSWCLRYLDDAGRMFVWGKLDRRRPMTSLQPGQRRKVADKYLSLLRTANALMHQVKYLCRELLTDKQKHEFNLWIGNRAPFESTILIAWLPGVPTLSPTTTHEFTVKVGNGQTRKLFWLQEHTLDSRVEELGPFTGWFTARKAFGYEEFFERYEGKVFMYQVELV